MSKMGLREKIARFLYFDRYLGRMKKKLDELDREIRKMEEDRREGYEALETLEEIREERPERLDDEDIAEMKESEDILEALGGAERLEAMRDDAGEVITEIRRWQCNEVDKAEDNLKLWRACRKQLDEQIKDLEFRLSGKCECER